jgi:hypothetical protein
LEHTNGVVTERHCNNSEKDKVIIHGHRFKMFFKKGDQEVPAVLNQPGPGQGGFMLKKEVPNSQVKDVADQFKLSLPVKTAA